MRDERQASTLHRKGGARILIDIIQGPRARREIRPLPGSLSLLAASRVHTVLVGGRVHAYQRTRSAREALLINAAPLSTQRAIVDPYKNGFRVRKAVRLESIYIPPSSRSCVRCRPRSFSMLRSRASSSLSRAHVVHTQKSRCPMPCTNRGTICSRARAPVACRPTPSVRARVHELCERSRKYG